MLEADLTTLGQRIRYAREIIGDSIEDMSHAFAVTSSTVLRWENLNVIPTLPASTRDELVPLIAKYLGCSLEWLQSGAGPKPNNTKVISLNVVRRHKNGIRRSAEFKEMIASFRTFYAECGELAVGPVSPDDQD